MAEMANSIWIEGNIIDGVLVYLLMSIFKIETSK